MNISQEAMITLDVEQPIWDRFFMVAPLVLIGTRNPPGAEDRYNLAPKHMASPMGWQNVYGFVCAPTHRTYQNIRRNGAFSVSFPGPDQVVTASLGAEPREHDDTKPSMPALPTTPASRIDALLVADSYLHLECDEAKIIDGFGDNSLIVGRIVAAQVHEDALRISDSEDAVLLRRMPLLAYVSPGRFARIEETFNFPFPEGYRR